MNMFLSLIFMKVTISNNLKKTYRMQLKQAVNSIENETLKLHPNNSIRFSMVNNSLQNAWTDANTTKNSRNFLGALW